MTWDFSLACLGGVAIVAIVATVLHLRNKRDEKARRESDQALHRAQEKIHEVGLAAQELRVEPDSTLFQALRFVGDGLTAYAAGDYPRARAAADDAIELASAAQAMLEASTLS
ncbi:MAG: hypothetical protein KGS72_26350 [Cyanobacteria bacterium REEB67]|nr:hypothetical protein [Cyanobacteria bacterium REEB67]